jgi:hypothetical protein
MRLVLLFCNPGLGRGGIGLASSEAAAEGTPFCLDLSISLGAIVPVGVMRH